MSKKFELKPLEHLIAQEIAALADSFKLVELSFNSCGNPPILRLYVASTKECALTGQDQLASITLNDCVKISYHMRIFLKTVPDLRFSNYVLEVSSPGLDRKF